MSKINCYVNTCAYHCDGGCRLKNVQVDGETLAHNKAETACASYTDCHSAGACNSADSGCVCNNTAVSCSVCSCKFQKDGVCHADRITVDSVGDNRYVCNCDQTQCRSFEAK